MPNGTSLGTSVGASADGAVALTVSSSPGSVAMARVSAIRYNPGSMRLSRAFIPTLKESPADAQVVSHVLMVRGGFIRKVAAGIYSFLPLGWRVLQKIERIVREEMNRAGAQEV